MKDKKWKWEIKVKNRRGCGSKQSGGDPKIVSHSYSRFLVKKTFISNQQPARAFQPVVSPDVKMMCMHKILSVPPFKRNCYV